MSDLLSALQRLERRESIGPRSAAAPTSPVARDSLAAATATPPHLRPSAWDSLELPPDAEGAASRETVDALLRTVGRPDVAAVIGVGLRCDLASLFMPLADAVAARSGCEAAAFGPGLLDDADGLAVQRHVLQRRSAYGFVLAPAERALLRPVALRQTCGAIAVVELGATLRHELATVRGVLADRQVPFLGTLVIEPT